MTGRPWFVYAAVATIALLILPFAWPFLWVTRILLSIIAVSLGCTVYMVWVDRNKYSLRQLERVHTKLELQEIEEVEAGTASIICIQCGNEYHPRFPTCPLCAQPWR